MIKKIIKKERRISNCKTNRTLGYGLGIHFKGGGSLNKTKPGLTFTKERRMSKYKTNRTSEYAFGVHFKGEDRQIKTKPILTLICLHILQSEFKNKVGWFVK